MGSSAEWQDETCPPLAEAQKPASRHDFDVSRLHQLASRVSLSAPLPEVLAQVVELVTAVVTCDSCFVYVLESDALVLRASKNHHPDVLDRIRLKLGEGITGWVAEHRQPVALSQGAFRDPRFQVFNELPEDRFEALLSVPVLSRGRVVGALNVQSRDPHRYSDREVALVATIGLLVGTEIELARLESENVRLSLRLENRKLVERAKGILQRNLNISEAEAYTLLQRESQQRRRSMKEIAEAVLLSHAITHGDSNDRDGTPGCR